MTIGGAFACNPISNAGCPAGKVCFSNFSDSTCYSLGPNPQISCGDCSIDGCASGFACGGDEPQCIKYCCDDGDCGSGRCEKLMLGTPTPAGFGVCVQSDSTWSPVPGAPAAYGQPKQSCAGGLTCGAFGCCDSGSLPAGTFPMGRGAGSDAVASGWNNELPEHSVSVSAFQLDLFEVSVSRFRAFVNQYTGAPPPAGAGSHPLIPGSGWQSAWNASLPATQAMLRASVSSCDQSAETWTDLPGPNEDRGR